MLLEENTGGEETYNQSSISKIMYKRVTLISRINTIQYKTFEDKG